MSDIQLQSGDLVLFIINDNAIRGTTRFQKYGFLLFKQYTKELDNVAEKHNIAFYDDWKPFHYGPYSEKLSRDLKHCVESKILRKTSYPTNTDIYLYSLTMKGRVRWRQLLGLIPEIREFDTKIKNLQKISFTTLLRDIYQTYPEYTSKSKIRNYLN